MIMPANKDRAYFATRALEEYQRVTGTDGDSAVQDLVTDLHHLVVERDGSWEVTLAGADASYDAESSRT